MQESAGGLDGLFAALANDKRRDMIHDLALQPSTVQRLALDHGLSLPAIHKHIRALEQSGLILRKKVGRTNFITINRQGLRQLQAWANQFQTDWGNDVETLENYIGHNRG